MNSIELFWKQVAVDIEDKYGKGHPSEWGKSRIDNFLIRFEDDLVQELREDNNLFKVLGLSMKNIEDQFRVLKVPGYDTFRRIFIVKNPAKKSKGTPYSRNLFAIYLGFRSFDDYTASKGLDKIVGEFSSKSGIKENPLSDLKEKKQKSTSNNKLNLRLISILVITFSTIIFGVSKYMNPRDINDGDTEGGNEYIITGNNSEVYSESVIIYQNSEEEKTRRNIHDLSLYITHYFSSLLDSSNPKYFELKVRQIDTIKNELEKHLEFIGINDKIKIPKDTLESRYLIKEMVEFEKKEIKPKIRISFGESYYYTYVLSRNMWQYEYFFNIYQKTGDIHTQEALIKLRNNIPELSGKVDFNIDRRELSSFLYDPTTESIDEIILEKKLQ